MPLMIIPFAGYSGGSSAIPSQELNSLSLKIDALSQRISAIEEALEDNNINIDPQDDVVQMLDDVFSDGFVDDDDNPQDPEYTDLLDDVFSGNDLDDPDNISDDDADLFGDFDDIFNP